MENTVYTGYIKMFNNKYGFIKYDKGEIFFHASEIRNGAILKLYDKISFRIAESKVKRGSLQAVDINFLAEDVGDQQTKLFQLPKYYGYIEWYNDKGFGCISSNKEQFFFHDSVVKTKFFEIEEYDHVTVFFDKRTSKKHKGQEEACNVILVDYHPLDKLLTKTVQQSISEIGFVDTLLKYERLKKYLGIFKSKGKLPSLNDLNVDEQFYFQLWKDGFISEVNYALVVEELSELNNYRDFAELFEHAFTQIKEATSQEKILKGLVNKLGKIDNELTFNKIRTVLGSEKISGEAKTIFCDTVFDLCDQDKKYLLWIHGYTERVDLDYVAERLFKNITPEAYQKVCNRLREESSQIILLEKLNDKIGEIDNARKYQDVKIVFDGSLLPKHSSTALKELATKYFYYIYKNVIFEESCSKPKLNIDNLFNANNRTESLIEFFECYSTHKLFEVNWIIALLYNLSISERLTVLYGISKTLLLKPEKNKHKGTPIIKLIRDGELPYVYNNLNLFPEHFFETIKRFCAVKSTGSTFRYFKSSSYVRRVNAVYAILKSNLISLKLIEAYYTLQDSKYILHDVKHIRAYKELLVIYSKVENFDFITTVIQPQVEETVEQLITSDSHELTGILIDLKYLSESSFKLLSEQLQTKIPIHLKLKLWVHNLSDYFDFNSFCIYYFTLSSEERSEFNKKAKAIMGKSLKQSMLREHEPWVFSHVEEETNSDVFTATWKSIWFETGCIKFCIDNEFNYSSRFNWDYSEESFNLLFNYITGRSHNAITVYVKHNVIHKVEGLEDLEEIIWKAKIEKEIATGGNSISRASSFNKIPVNILLRNQCIQYLNKIQLIGLEPTHILEKTLDVNTVSTSIDHSFLYSIPLSTAEIAVIWESIELNKSKATHIFKCSPKDYESVFSEIEQQLQVPKVRSMLNSSDQDSLIIKEKLRYIRRVDHHNFDFNKWEEDLCNVLPELRKISSELVI